MFCGYWQNALLLVIEQVWLQGIFLGAEDNLEFMEDVFVSNIHINKVRHLENLDIPLSTSERKHLILTGKNGSGKTSALLEIKDFIRKLDSKTISSLKFWKKNKYEPGQVIPLNSDYHEEARKVLTELRQILVNYRRSDQALNLTFNAKNFSEIYFNEHFLFAFFEAKRFSDFKQPLGPQQLDVKRHYTVGEKANFEFVQYLVNLRYNYLEAKENGKLNLANNIENWINNFQDALRLIFDDDDLKLIIDSKNFKYNLITKDRETFDLSTLSDGFSAIVNIITELIMRMENKKQDVYDMQGLVLIDEIETHLHIDLQKKILPFLTRFFPKIQFIVTTHSPFVLTSLKDAIIYDLESQEPIEDLSGYSVEAIIEGYFGADKYSDALKEKVNEYEQLAKKDDLSFSEEKRYQSLKKYFDDLSDVFAEELKLKIQEIRMLKPVE